ncbi:MAG: SGNH/GDSL hydrolase family protein, partial [Acidobacteria bacterium]|nr:SGNH/GDSL hydrolase family protein [Acidobacteriota bacterium]
MVLSNFFKNTVLFVLSLMGCLVSLELGLRLYSVFFFPKMMVLDDKLGWRHARRVERVFPNELGEKVLVVQNSFGNRGTAHNYQKTQGKCRILVLGDSFTEGVQVGEEDVFTRVLERKDPALEVINAGVGGYGTVQEYLYLRSDGLRFNPDAVLLMFFENDLTDNCLSYYPGFGPRPYAKMVNGEVQIVERLNLSEYRKFTLPAPFQ